MGEVMQTVQIRQGMTIVALLAAVLLAAAGTLLPVAALAQERAGTVVAVRGRVEVERQGARQRLRARDPVYVEDTIHTNNGRVQLMFTDHSLVSLGRNTVFSVREYRYRPGEGEGALKTRVAEGVFRVVGGAITRIAPENFTTETPTATIGIRGSMYSGIYRNQTLSVLFEGGRGIFVRNRFGAIDLLRPNLMTTVPAGRPPSPPKKATPADLQQFFKELAAPVGEEEAAPAGAGQQAGGEQQAGQQQETTAREQETTTQAQDAVAGDGTGTGDEGTAGTAFLGEEGASGLPAGPGQDGNAGDAGLPPLGEEPLLAGAPDDTGPLDLGSVQDAVQDAVQDVVQQQTTQQVEESVGEGGGATEPVRRDLRGAFTAGTYLLPPGAVGPGEPDMGWWGTVVLADQGQGRLVGTEIADVGTIWPLDLDTAAGVSSPGLYTSFGGISFTRTLDLGGTLRPVQGEASFTPVSPDTSPEFVFWTEGLAPGGNPGLEFHHVGFAGAPATGMPSSGVSQYGGVSVLSFRRLDGSFLGMEEPDAAWWVDFATGAVVGMTEGRFAPSDWQRENEGIWFGRLGPGGDLSGLSFWGEAEPGDAELYFSAVTGTGSLFASGAIAHGWSAVTTPVALDGTPAGSAHVLAVGVRTGYWPAADAPAHTGSPLRGFMSGVLEAIDPATGAPSSRVVAWDGGDLVFTPGVDGRLTGSLLIQDANDSGIDTTRITAGAAVADTIFVGVTEPFPNGRQGRIWTALAADQFPGAVWGGITLPYQEGEGLWIASSRPDLEAVRLATGTGGTAVHAAFAGPAVLRYTESASGIFDAVSWGSVNIDFDLSGATFTADLDFSTYAGRSFSASGTVNGARFSGTDVRNATTGGTFATASIWGRVTGTHPATDAGLLGAFYAATGDGESIYNAVFGGYLTGITTTTPPVASGQEGRFLSVLFSTDTGALVEGWYGTAAVGDPDGDNVFAGTLTDAASSGSRAFTLDETVGTPDVPFLGFAYASPDIDATVPPRTMDLLGAPRTLSPSQIVYDSSGHAFRFFGGMVGSFSDTAGNGYSYSDFGYAGVPTASLPTSGVGVYSVQGAGLVRPASGGNAAGIFASGELWVDFATRKVLARIEGRDPSGAASTALPLEDAFLFGTLGSGNDFSSLVFAGAGNGLLYPDVAPETGSFFLDTGRGVGFAVTGPVEDDTTGAAAGSYQFVAAGAGQGIVPGPTLQDATLSGGVAGIEAYHATDGSISALDAMDGDLTVTLTAGGGVAVSTTLTGDSGPDMPVLAATSGVAIRPDIFAAELANTEVANTWLPPGVLFTEDALFYSGIPPLQSLDQDHTAVWGRMFAPGDAAANDITALWAATSLPPWSGTAVFGSGAVLYRGKMRTLSGGAANGVQGKDDPGLMDFLFDPVLGFWRAKGQAGILTVPVPVDIRGPVDVASDTFSATNLLVDGVEGDTRGMVSGFYGGTAPDLLLARWRWSKQAPSPSIHTGVVFAEPDSGAAILHGSYFGGPDGGMAMGPLTAVNDDGTVWGFAAAWVTGAGAQGLQVPFDSTMPALASSGAWSEIVTQPFSFSESYWADTSFTATRHASSLGDFAYWLVPHTVFTTPTTGTFQMFAVAGARPAALGQDGITKYKGVGLEEYTSPGTAISRVLPNFRMAVNWHAGTALAVFAPDDPAAFLPLERIFFVGTVNPAATDPAETFGPFRVLGTTVAPNDAVSIATVDGSWGAAVYGTAAQGVELHGEGTFLDLSATSPTPAGGGRVLAAGMADPAAGQATAATGTASWEGFVTGVAGDMRGTDGWQMYMNSDPADLAMTIDRDTGTVAGILRARDRSGGAATAASSLDLDIGATTHASTSLPSAYIDDQTLAAGIGDASGVGVTVNGTTSTTLRDGPMNYLASAASQPATYATWGYWEASWIDPVVNAPYHLGGPGSLWVAGVRTPQADVQDLVGTQATATYTGSAMGVRIDTLSPSPTPLPLPTGSLVLDVDFGAGSLSGRIDFPADTATGFAATTLPLQGSLDPADPTVFSGAVTGAASSDVNGAFFGPNAGSVGGSFRADYDTGERYLGVFAGDTQ